MWGRQGLDRGTARTVCLVVYTRNDLSWFVRAWYRAWFSDWTCVSQVLSREVLTGCPVSISLRCIATEVLRSGRHLHACFIELCLIATHLSLIVNRLYRLSQYVCTGTDTHHRSEYRCHLFRGLSKAADSWTIWLGEGRMGVGEGWQMHVHMIRAGHACIKGCSCFCYVDRVIDHSCAFILVWSQRDSWLCNVGDDVIARLTF